MNRSGVSASVAGFLDEHIDSLELLHVLLLLHQNPTQWWTAQTIAMELRTQARSVEDRCAALARAGLVKAARGEVQFDATSPSAAVVDEVAAAYRTHRVAMIELIFTR